MAPGIDPVTGAIVGEALLGEALLGAEFVGPSILDMTIGSSSLFDALAGEAILGSEFFGPSVLDMTIGGGLAPSTSAFSLPFDLTTSDLLQGGMRLGGNLLQQNALNNAQNEVGGIKAYLDHANKGYTDEVMGVIDEMGARNTPEARAAAYGAEAGKDTATLGEAMTSASQSMPRFSSSGGNVSQRYMSGSAAADEAGRERINKLAELMGNLNAHQGRAQTEALNTALDQSKLNTIGADRRSTNRTGSLALAGVQPSGGQMMFGDLLGFAADAMAAKSKPAAKTKVI